MKLKLFIFLASFFAFITHSQEDLPTDYLSSDFHKNRRDALRTKMPSNSVAVFFSNPVRNKSNSVNYMYHQDPNFYYLTGYKEPHAVLIVFSEWQENDKGKYNEILYVQQRDAEKEMWYGRRLGVEGAKEKLAFDMVYNGKEFLNSKIDFSSFDKVLFYDFKDDYRNSERNKAELYDLIESFKTQIGYYINESTAELKNNSKVDQNKEGAIPMQRASIDTRTIKTYMAELREIKLPEEIELMKKAIRISAFGQIEVMKAMQPNMSEKEIQGIHDYVHRRYGSEYEAYPGIVGGGHNGCVLHYIENSKTNVEGDLVLMDLAAEYHGYSADVTRTIPANGKFTKEQKAIYDIVYEAQEYGINASVVGANRRAIHEGVKKIINEGLYTLGIIKSVNESHKYFPHGTSHFLGLDVHDTSSTNIYAHNMVITVEPGIYIPEGSDCDEKWWGIAVRIEDDILITDKGPINLSAEAPRTSDAIETMMKQKSALNDLKLPSLDD